MCAVDTAQEEARDIDSYMDIINNNPYRVLGLYSTSTTKERKSNVSKTTKFLNVGHSVDFVTDFPHLLPAIARTSSSVTAADASLTLPADQLRYAQFWFMNVTSLDGIAFNHLASGDTAGAEELWRRRDSMSSLQNRVVLALIDDNLPLALGTAEMLYNTYSSAFVSAIGGGEASTSSDELIHTFLDTLLSAGYTAPQIVRHLSTDEWRGYIVDKSVAPLIAQLTSAVATAAATKGSGPAARYAAGQQLLHTAKPLLRSLSAIITKSDIRYETIADKVCNEVLDCGIYYYNHTSDVDQVSKALSLQQAAASLAVGTMAKERCEKNLAVLHKAAAELPPAEVMAEYTAITAALAAYTKQPEKIEYAMTLLNTCKPHLQAMKAKLGATHSAYLKWSTIVVGNALVNIIAEVNAAQEGDDVIAQYIRLRPVLIAAWKATQLMDTFDMESDFKQGRYNDNRRILRDICSNHNINVFGDPDTPPPPRVEHPAPQHKEESNIPWGCIMYIAIPAIIILLSHMCSH